MIVLVDDDATAPIRRFRNAPPVSSEIGAPKYRNNIRDSFGGGNRNQSYATAQRSNSRPSAPGTPKMDRPGTSYSTGGLSVGEGSLQSFALG
jgi:hypothetical protein